MALTKLSSNEFQQGAITTDLISGDVALSVRIANVSIANSTYTVLDDTAVNVGGGYIVVTGAGFQSGAQVIINETPATSTTFVSSTELRAQVGAKSAATYDVYVVNPDGGNAISVNGITYSGLPTWVTGSTLDAQAVDVAFNVSLSATGATSYANTTALPAGTTLLSNGYFYGTVTGIESETTYNFTIRATDSENQDSDREFSLTVTVITAPATVEYLVVAGGGGGGSAFYSPIFGGGGGGGGAGGYRTGSLSVSSGTTYTITVGSGGNAGTGFPGPGFNGTDSIFSTITSAGGGGGGTGGGAGSSGGSGGGGGSRGTAGPGGTGNQPATSPSQGNNGGSGTTSSPYQGGGGGGAGASGSPAAGGGTGGLGQTNSISGTSTNYAGGGGGGNRAPSVALGQYGGGNGGNDSTPATSGAVNTGGGGGGSSQNGGSGIVIIRYADTYNDAAATTGSPTYSNTGGYKIYKFTGSGSITW